MENGTTSADFPLNRSVEFPSILPSASHIVKGIGMDRRKSCNLLFRQLLVHPEHGPSAAPDPHLGLPVDLQERARFISEAGMGLNPKCTIPRMASVGGQEGSVGNVANIILCSISIIIPLVICRFVARRRAAVGRVEMIVLLLIYALCSLFQLLDTGAILRQGSRAIVWITALHQTLVVSFFVVLVWLGLLGFQVVEDGSLTSFAILTLIGGFITVGSSYIFLDTGFSISHYFLSKPASHLYSPWTFSLIILWPIIACTLYVILTAMVITYRLGERRPMIHLISGVLTLILAEAARFGLSYSICRSSSGAVDSSFIATFLETAALGWLVGGWVAITEADWDDFEAWEQGPNLQQRKQPSA
ncbi:chitin synthase III catalytic subunit-domain-containing protein [Melampsora americana]|nr:chitin synthase III catalytic subunit-domain-containing protein [Melampsora americana]